MSFGSWIRNLFCFSPASHNKWERERRQYYYKRVEKANKNKGRLHVRLSQPSHQWSESTERIFRESEAPTPPRKDLPRRRPVPPPKDRVRPHHALTSPPREHYHPSTSSTQLTHTCQAQQAGPGRLSSPVRVRFEVVPSKSKMERCIVEEVIAIVGKSFHHIPYAITGLAAMIHHGFNKRLPSRVTLVCPLSCHDVIYGWALTCGMHSMQNDPDTFAVLTSDGKVRAIKMRFLETGFENIFTVRGSASGAKILSLSTIAGYIANDYVLELAEASEWKQNIYAEDMRWVLRQMIWRREPMSHQTAMSMMREDFWLPFTLSFPELVDLFHQLKVAPAHEDPANYYDTTLPENDIYYLDNASGLIELATSVANSPNTRRSSFSSMESVTGGYTAPTSHASHSSPSLQDGLERRRLEMYALDHPGEQQENVWH